MSVVDQIDHIEKLDLQLGDVVVVKLRVGFEPRHARETAQALKALLPDGVSIIMVDQDSEITVDKRWGINATAQ